MERGQISKIFPEKKFGSIKTAAIQEIRFYFTEIGGDVSAAVVGATVEFEKVQLPDGWTAKKVTVVEAMPNDNFRPQPNLGQQNYIQRANPNQRHQNFDQRANPNPRRQNYNDRPYHGQRQYREQNLPEESVFNSFYGQDGRLHQSLFFEAAQKTAECFEGAGLSSKQLRSMYQQLLVIVTKLRKNEAFFPEARELFSILFVERLERGVKRNLFNPIVKTFFERHKELVLSSSKQMLGFFRYLTNILCYLKTQNAPERPVHEMNLPQESVFSSFYDQDGKLKQSLFFEAAQQTAACFEKARLGQKQIRSMYQQLLGVMTQVRKNEAFFPEAREKFALLYVEKIARGVKRNIFNPVVKTFFDHHKKIALSDSKEMLGFFRYLTNIICYLKAKN
jgi:CRISPR/Cas system CSM-associated protein Csm2 small subunit